MPPRRKAKPARNHQLADIVPKYTTLTDLRKKVWILGEPIASGGFGWIYLADDTKDKVSKEKAHYAIKIEPHGNGPLYCELAFYQRAAKVETLNAWKKSSGLPYVGIPAYIAHGLHNGADGDLRFMVMPRYGSDLHSMWTKSNNRFRRDLVCQLAVQLVEFAHEKLSEINALEYMHENEYVHADVKGANILLGFKDPSQIFLVDFGLAYRYMVDGKHKAYHEDPKKAHDGTIEYTSRDAHLGVVPSRRSDLEILGYVLLHWISGRLPWEDKLSDKNYVKDQKLKHMKNVKNFVSAVYPEAKSHKDFEIERFLQNVSELGYDQKPDYKVLRKYFQDALTSMGVSVKAKIDFNAETSEPSSSRKRRSKNTKHPNSTSNSQNSMSDEGFVKQPKRQRRVDSKRTPSSSWNRQSDPKVTQNSMSDESVEEPPKQPRRAAAKRKPIIVSSEESMEVITDEDSAVRKHKKVRGQKFCSNRSADVETSFSENTEYPSTDENFEPIHKFPAKKSKKTVSYKASKIPGTTDDVESSASSKFEESHAATSSAKSNLLYKSRYSMAPLHTQSVLGKGDKLTGERSGKHPVILRRRKVKRPKADAVTQTTPSLHKRSSRT